MDIHADHRAHHSRCASPNWDSRALPSAALVKATNSDLPSNIGTSTNTGSTIRKPQCGQSRTGPAQCERIHAYAAVSAAPAPRSAARAQTRAGGDARAASRTGIDTRKLTTGRANPSSALGQSAARNVEKG